jgi:hypothetical protein
MSTVTIRPYTAALGVALTLVIGGCDGPGIVESGDLTDVRSYVTGAAASSLDGEGLFTIPAAISPSTIPIITAQTARELASSYVLSFGADLKRYWDQERGRPIDISQLQPDSRVFFAATSYALFPEGYHPAFRRTLGPYYLVRMGTGTRPELLVAVAAYNTELGVNDRGKLIIPPISGMEFVSGGIPVDTTRRRLASLLTPEEAVIRVSQITGARVSEVPELRQLGFPLGPMFPAWKLTLERSVRVRAVSGSFTTEVATLYVGREQGRELLIPAAEQPSSEEVLAARMGPDGEDLGPSKVSLPILATQPTKFEAVTVIRSGAS